MKKIITALLGLIFVSFSVAALADKIVITGAPITVEEQNDVYVPQGTVTTTTTTSDYYYYTFGDTKRVCYKEVQPALVSMDAGVFKFKMGESVVSMHCYNYSPDYFVVE